MKHKKEQSTETTNYISPRVSMLEPNEEIPIYTGEFLLKDGEKIIKLTGAIRYSWLPAPDIRFSGISMGINYKYRIDSEKLLIVNNHIIGEAKLTAVTTSNQDQALDGICSQAILGDTSTPVNEVYFVVPNLNFFPGETVQIILEDKKSLFVGGMNLEYGNYTVALNLLSKFPVLEAELNAKGGYLITGCGVLKMKNVALQFKDVFSFSKDLSIFVGFLNGRRADISFLTGVHESVEIWKHFGWYQTDLYLPTINWAQILEPIDYQSMFTEFMKLRENKADRDFIELAIHWYLEASKYESYMEGGILFIQTSLELVYNWLLIEKKQLIIRDDADKTYAAKKIRLILSLLDISPTIPTELTSLSSIKGFSDGPDIFVKIRNALVHGKEKNRNLLRKISPIAKTEVLKLGLWYIELSLLYVLDYKGNYYNRISRQSELVPWFKS